MKQKSLFIVVLLLCMQFSFAQTADRKFTIGLNGISTKYADDLGGFIVYAVDIDTAKPETEYTMNPLGHSHYAGKDGSINTDLKTITTALQIAKRITVKIK